MLSVERKRSSGVAMVRSLIGCWGAGERGMLGCE